MSQTWQPKNFYVSAQSAGKLTDIQDRVHDAWLPDSARQQVRQIIKKIQVQLKQRQEFGWEYEPV